MNKEQLDIMTKGKGFIAALDQSGGSTPKALKIYGVEESEYNGTAEMFEKVHEMRSRIITSENFTKDYIIGVILFEETMNSKIDGKFTADYLWDVKGIVPFLKIDKGLAEKKNGVQLMKDIPNLDELLNEAKDKNIFGTKMRSLILEDNDEGIKEVVEQQFKLGKQILEHDLMPILEPEIDIHAEHKVEIEVKMKRHIFELLDTLEEGQKVMFKLSPPEDRNFYIELVNDPRVVRVVFLSGGHSRERSNELLAENYGVIASFSRGFTQGLHANQSKEEFDDMLGKSAKDIYEASIK
ncbi:MAG: fructose bisphosphate aldolase [Tissierellia bacterium]|jgi:fructose-bisphosphate aldolase class I|nr:fructose bisphosphate aldolase [Tissierellia bacterium]